MLSKVKILGHPIHPMLVSFPIAFYAAAFFSYLAYSTNGNLMWFQIGVVANIAGVIIACLAAIPGIVDWALAIPSEQKFAKQTGLIHMACNIVALILFAVSAYFGYQQWGEAIPSLGSILLLTGIGLLTTITAGFFGWTLVQKYHVGVDLNSEQEYNEDFNRKKEVFSTGAHAKA
jgi:uncharacterized membrane protein